MIKIIDERKCCGCSACSNACPEKCIKMEKGVLGHFYAVVDEAICINCGICNIVCPMEDSKTTTEFPQKVYAAYSLDVGVRYRGSSGGMFETFARYLLANGYSIYGAAFDDNLQLKCACANNEVELLPLMKSKYLQVDFNDKYFEIQTKLEKNGKVFIVSTPCQIAALKGFLKKDYPNLITSDFFCHGVPSQQFFDECILFDEKKKFGGKVIDYIFRSKKRNASCSHYFTVKYDKNGVLRTKTSYYFNSTFYAFFQRYICFRESCYNCRFSGSKRYSDITIGDFHKIDKYCKGINRFDGVSTVVVNTKQGQDLFDSCKNTLIVHEMDLEKLITDGTIFSGGSSEPKNRPEFIEDYNKMDLESLVNKYVNRKTYCKNRIYYYMPTPIRKILKNIRE